MTNVTTLRQPEAKPEPGSFEEFWQAFPFPRRQNKALAKAKWEKITGDGLDTKMLDKSNGSYEPMFLKATPQEILEGVKRYDAKHRHPHERWRYKDDGKYVAAPHTWLNRGGWLDD